METINILGVEYVIDDKGMDEIVYGALRNNDINKLM